MKTWLLRQRMRQLSYEHDTFSQRWFPNHQTLADLVTRVARSCEIIDIDHALSVRQQVTLLKVASKDPEFRSAQVVGVLLSGGVTP